MKDLVQKLNENPVLRYNCGFDVLGSVPSASTFSRFMSKLSLSDELSCIFRDIVLQANEQGVIDGSNASLDSTKLSSYEAFQTKCYTMDSGYDFESNYRSIIDDYNAIPVIAYNPKGSKTPPEGMNDHFKPIYSAGYPLTYYGVDGDYLKFRCPHVTGHCDCSFGSNWCSSSDYGYTTKINWKQNPRHYGYPHRDSENWQKLYNTRTSVERMFSRMKKYLNLDSIRSKGILKAKAYALLNCIALVAGTIAVN